LKIQRIHILDLFHVPKSRAMKVTSWLLHFILFQKLEDIEKKKVLETLEKGGEFVRQGSTDSQEGVSKKLSFER
jgi:hypothetical protein